MAGDWTKIRNDIEDDPAVIYMAKALKIDTDHCVGKLRRIWAWADQQTRDGRIDFVTEDEVDRRASVALFARHMAHVGWLIIGDGFIEFPKWDTHNSNSAKSRAGNSKRQQKSRECRAHGATNARQKRDQRREEKSIEVAKATSCEAVPPPARKRTFRDDVWDKIAGRFFAGKVPKDQEKFVGQCVTKFIDRGINEGNLNDIDARHERMRLSKGDNYATLTSLLKHWFEWGPDRIDEPAFGGQSTIDGAAARAKKRRAETRQREFAEDDKPLPNFMEREFGPRKNNLGTG